MQTPMNKSQKGKILNDVETADSAVEYIFEKMEEKLELFNIEFKKELGKQLEK